MPYDYEDESYMDYDDDEFHIDFAEPGGNSALRAATSDNPRDQPCPTCEWPNRLTRKDVELGYQCDRCADACEGCGEIDYYEPPEPLTSEQLTKRIESTFKKFYSVFNPTVTVNGTGTDHIRVVMTFPGTNQSLDFSGRIYSDDGPKLRLYCDATDSHISISVMSD